MRLNNQPLRSAIVTCAIALVACAAIQQTGESQRTARLDHAARLTNEIDAAAAVIAQRATLMTRRNRLRAALGATLRRVDSSTRVASFVRDSARIAAQHRTTIAAIVPQVTPGTTLPALTFDVTIEGEYPDVLATLGDFASLTYPADVAVTSIARTNPHAVEATVSAAIRVTLDVPSPGESA
jgi:hypothetical protein